MSAPVAFACTGDNSAQMLAWKPCETTDRTTMVIDERCRLELPAAYLKPALNRQRFCAADFLPLVDADY
jgi:hypothetical protein